MRKTMRKSGNLVHRTFEYLETLLKPGITTQDLDKAAHTYITSQGGIPAPLTVGFPKSVCTSVNDVLAHGIPSDVKLRSGDILRLDISLSYNGCFTDSCRTYVIGSMATHKGKFVFVDKAKKVHSELLRWLDDVAPNVTTGDIGQKTYELVSRAGLHVIPQLGGHGIGTQLHQNPFVPSVGVPGDGVKLRPGMYLAIEPLITDRPSSVEISPDKWALISPEGAHSAQFEHTIRIKSKGIEILT